jgi:hypothetical protein
MARSFGYPMPDWTATKDAARTVLRSQVAIRTPITYSDLAVAIGPIHFDPASPAFHEMLGEISTEEDKAGRGMLSVLVVHKGGDMRPGKGFFRLARQLGRSGPDREALWQAELKVVLR